MHNSHFIRYFAKYVKYFTDLLGKRLNKWAHKALYGTS